MTVTPLPVVAPTAAASGQADAAPAADAAHDSAAHTPCSVEVIDEYARFVDLEPEWNEAVQRAGTPHPFLRHEWLRTWWDAFGAGRRLHVLVVRANTRIVAIAPLMRERAQMFGIPVRRIAFLQNDHTPRADVIVADRCEDAYLAIWNALRSGRESWDVLQLNQIVRDSETALTIARLAAADGCAVGTWASSDSPFLRLSGSWEAYFDGLPSKFRQNLRNRMARLTRLGEPALEVLDDPSAIGAACDDAWRLEASGWKQQTGTALGADPAVDRFYRLLAERAAERGWLRFLFLTVGGRRIATSYGSCYENRLFLFKTGYDPEYATCSPFKLLAYFAMQRAFAEELTEVDFLGDSEPWKLEWTRTTRGHDWLFVFSTTVRARLLHSLKFQWGPEWKRWRA